MKNVFVDANFAIGRYRGMGRYLNHFIDTLEKSPLSLHVLKLLRTGLNQPGYHSFGFSNYVLWEQVSLPHFIRLHWADIILLPYNTAPIFLNKKSKKILILHDLIFFKSFKEVGFSVSLLQNIGRIYRRLVVPRAIKQADVIITVSNYTKEEILKRYKGISKRIYVIPNAINLNEFNKSSSQGPRQGLKDEFILHVGGDAPQKNSKSTILAYSRLDLVLKEKYRLKILGLNSSKMIHDLRVLIESLGLSSKIEISTFVNRESLQEFYGTASLFLFPSFYEGFGIPLIEAMASGCPIACSNTSCLPEIVGDAGEYFDPKDINQQTAAIERVLKSDRLRLSLIQKGYTQVKKYSSEKIGELIYDFANREMVG